MQIVMQILELQTFYLLIILRQETVFILFCHKGDSCEVSLQLAFACVPLWLLDLI